MLAYRDFVPKQLRVGLQSATSDYESLDAVVSAAGEWIRAERIQPINIETVVLPNIWGREERGSEDPSLRTSGGSSSAWHQFVRVWYSKG